VTHYLYTARAKFQPTVTLQAFSEPSALCRFSWRRSCWRIQWFSHLRQVDSAISGHSNSQDIHCMKSVSSIFWSS